MPSTAIFSFNLNKKILPGLVTVAKFTEDSPDLVGVTPSNKIFIKSLGNCETGRNAEEEIRLLNFSQPVTGLKAIRFGNGDRQSDLLVAICSKDRIIAYDVHLNREAFAREVPDGGNVLEFGRTGSTEVVLVGGNCSVQGFDKAGTDSYWIVTGDNVRSMAMVDVDGDGQEELIVGSDDYDIRIFKGEDLVQEITEAQMVTHLLNVGNCSFAYTLANGTVGIYERLNRLWRVKSKNRVTCLHKYDINGDGSLELITGWQGGKIDGRHIETGEVLFKDNFEDTIAGICEADCSGTGRGNDLVVVSVSGEVRLYNPRAPRRVEIKKEISYERETVRELLERKQALLLELKNYECNVRYVNAEKEIDETQCGAIPAKTRLHTTVGVSTGKAVEQKCGERKLSSRLPPTHCTCIFVFEGSGDQVPHVDVEVSTNNDTVIRAIIVFAEGIFKGETHVEHPKADRLGNKLRVSLYPPRDVPIDIHLKALVGYPESKQFHVFEVTRQLPRFSMYATVSTPATVASSSSVSFTLYERIQRVVLWINRNFLLSPPLDLGPDSDLDLHLISLRDGKPVAIRMDRSSGTVKIETDDIAVAGDFVQSLAAYLNLQSLKSNADFPLEEKNCVQLLEKLRELESIRAKLKLESGEKSNSIRHLLIRSEDSRLLKDWKSARRFYRELDELNRNLQRNYEIRRANYSDLTDAIKGLNGIVQKASRLRFGKHKTDPVAISRVAIATNNPKSLIKAIRTGET